MAVTYAMEKSFSIKALIFFHNSWLLQSFIRFYRAALPEGAAGKGRRSVEGNAPSKFGGFHEIQGQLEHSAGQVVAGDEEVEFDVAAGAGERIPRRREAAWPLA